MLHVDFKSRVNATNANIYEDYNIVYGEDGQQSDHYEKLKNTFPGIDIEKLDEGIEDGELSITIGKASFCTDFSDKFIQNVRIEQKALAQCIG